MIKVKQFYAEMTYDGYWEETKGVDEFINEFLEEHKNIEVIDIKYATGQLDEIFQSCALLIYKGE